MGAIGSMLGTAGGTNGTGFSINNAVSTAQTNNAYDLSTQALQQQNAFTQAAQASGLSGLGTQQNVLNQLQGVANGTGPNPAQAQLAQATGANVANQAALMAGQRGASQNVGMMARQAAQQGAATQQQSAGQAATLQAQQSLGALQGMGSLATQQAGQAQNAGAAQTQGSLGLQSNLLNAMTGQNSANASLINTSMGQQAQLIGNVMGSAGSAIGLANGGEVPGMNISDSTPVNTKPSSGQTGSSGGISQLAALLADGGSVVPGSGQYAPISANNDPWATLGTQNTQAPAQAAPVPAAYSNSKTSSAGPKSNAGKYLSGQSSGAGAAGNFIGTAIGTGLKNLFSSGSTASNKSDNGGYDQYAGSGFSPAQMDLESSRSAAQSAGGLPAISPVDDQSGQMNPQEQMPASSDGLPMAAKGGRVPALVSPGEVYLDKKAVNEVAKGKDPIKAGEKIPGKAKVKGNSYANDTVPKTLESGGIVLPKSVMESKHPHWAAHQFVSQIMAKNGNMPSKAKKK